ncbi:hypothetical protein B0H21DRAFT_744900 [Amylocystis lapponica]|nr:hypothetical protein B0H21DRAFT_744900 [Amylocystis lapponica]
MSGEMFQTVSGSELSCREMHRCLNVTEILRNIIEQAYEDGSLIECRKCTGYLSSTCRAFYAVGVEVLWSRLSGLAPLIKCMPSEIWEQHRIDTSDAPDDETYFIISLLRCPSPDGWKEFERKAIFVKTFSWNHPYYSTEVEAETFRKISLHRPGTVSLLPNLRELQWWGQPSDVFEYINLFLSPDIRILDAGKPSNYEAALTILRSIGAKCPCLEKLFVGHTLLKALNHQPPVPSSSICALHYLRVVELPYPLTVDSIVHLATLPALTELHLVLYTDQRELCVRLSQTEIPLFPALRILNVAFADLEAATVPFFRFIHSGTLEKVQISSLIKLMSPIASQLREHLEVLANHPCCTILTSLELNFSWDDPVARQHGYPPPEVPARVLNLRALSPILMMTRLQNLTITSFHLDLDDDALATCAAALPELQTLSLLQLSDNGKVS